MDLGGRNTKRMLERMGVEMNEIADVKEVIIRTSKKNLIIRNAAVSEINAKGTKVFQVMGSDVEEVDIESPKFSEEDILLVSQQAGVTKERAQAALEDSNGDLAQAIMKLS